MKSTKINLNAKLNLAGPNFRNLVKIMEIRVQLIMVKSRILKPCNVFALSLTSKDTFCHNWPKIIFNRALIVMFESLLITEILSSISPWTIMLELSYYSKIISQYEIFPLSRKYFHCTRVDYYFLLFSSREGKFNFT